MKSSRSPRPFPVVLGLLAAEFVLDALDPWAVLDEAALALECGAVLAVIGLCLWRRPRGWRPKLAVLIVCAWPVWVLLKAINCEWDRSPATLHGSRLLAWEHETLPGGRIMTRPPVVRHFAVLEPWPPAKPTDPPVRWRAPSSTWEAIPQAGVGVLIEVRRGALGLRHIAGLTPVAP